MFQDSQPAKTAITQPRPALHQKLLTSDPPISPPQSPGGDASGKLGAFAFEKQGLEVPSASIMYGAREELSSLTPSNSNTADVHGARSQRMSQNSVTSEKTNNHLIRPVPVSGVSRSGAVPENAYPGLLAPPSLETASLLPIIIPPVNANKLPSPQALPSNGLDDLEFNRTDVALADYLISLCSQPTAPERDILRQFFCVRRPATPALSTSTGGAVAHPATPIYSSATESLNARTATNADKTISAGAPIAEVKDFSKAEDEAMDCGGDDGIARNVQIGVSDSENQAILGDVRARRQSEPSCCEDGQPTSTDMSQSPSDSVAVPNDGSGGLGVRNGQPRKATIDDFDLIRTLGKGCAGKVSRCSRHRKRAVLMSPIS